MREIVIDAPGKNAISTEVLEGLERDLNEAAGEPVLLTGKGDAFSAGLNLEEVAGFDRAGLDAFLAHLDRACALLFDYPAPTVAWVNGHAIAGGSVIALCCDHRVGADNPKMKLGLNETALGVTFPPIVFRIVRHRLGERLAPEVMLGAGLFGPEEAHRLGILDALGTREDAEAALSHRASHPVDAYAATKAQLQAGVTGLGEAAAAQIRSAAMVQWTSETFRARIAAALGR